MNFVQRQLWGARAGQLALKGDVCIAESFQPEPPVSTPSMAIPQGTHQKVPPTIVEQVAQFVERFVFFGDRRVYFLVATWIIATHMYERFDYMGYVFAHSPERESGKTTLLDVIHLLSFNSSGIQISPAEASIFRTANDRTQIFDEVDALTNADTLRSVLNAGYRLEAVVTRLAAC